MKEKSFEEVEVEVDLNLNVVIWAPLMMGLRASNGI
jgi:hypothetical protein